MCTLLENNFPFFILNFFLLITSYQPNSTRTAQKHSKTDFTLPLSPKTVATLVEDGTLLKGNRLILIILRLEKNVGFYPESIVPIRIHNDESSRGSLGCSRTQAFSPLFPLPEVPQSTSGPPPFLNTRHCSRTNREFSSISFHLFFPLFPSITQG